MQQSQDAEQRLSTGRRSLFRFESGYCGSTDLLLCSIGIRQDSGQQIGLQMNMNRLIRGFAGQERINTTCMALSINKADGMT